jgi:hypothetical protein
MRLIFLCIGGWFVLAIAATFASADPVVVRTDWGKAPLAAGEPLLMNVIVARYGRPVAGKPPVVKIRHGRDTRTFKATRTDRRGVYQVRLVFPTAGRWNYEIPYGGHVRRSVVEIGRATR